MRSITSTLVVAGGLVGLIGAAQATDLTGAEIKAYISGKTAYLETTAASAGGLAGQVVIYWNADGTAIYKTPKGTIMHGTWQIKDNTNCTNWKERPGTGCVRYDMAGGVVTVIDVATGKTRAKIVKTAPGNAEKLVP